jgi:hypothetical protein
MAKMDRGRLNGFFCVSGLFSKLITMSGNALCPWALQKNPGEKVVRLGKAVGCLDEGAVVMDDAAYKCLRELDAVTLTTSWTSAFHVRGYIDIRSIYVWQKDIPNVVNRVYHSLKIADTNNKCDQ